MGFESSRRARCYRRMEHLVLEIVICPATLLGKYRRFDMNDTPQIFISYSRKNVERARQIFASLGRYGWNVYMDEQMPTATRFAEHIINHLRSADCVLVLWSKESHESDWVICEASLALARNKLVHACLDSPKPPSMFSEYQAADLSNWSGDDENPEWRRLLARISSNVNRQRPAGVTLAEPANFEDITNAHIALTSSSWFRTKTPHDPRYRWQIHVMLVGAIDALNRVENVVYLFDRSYGINRPEKILDVHKEYALTSNNRDNNFGIYELANGYSVVTAKVKIRNQSTIVELSRLVDIMDQGPVLKELYANTNPLWINRS